MCLFEDLHEAGVSLSVDEVDIGVKIVVFERVQPFHLLTIPLLLLILLLLGQKVLRQVSVALDFAHPLFVKLDELFLAIKDFFEELFATSASTHLLA